MTANARLILLVLVLFGVMMTTRRWTKARSRLLQQRLSLFIEADQLLLWGGLLLSVLGSGVLVLYLLLQP